MTPTGRAIKKANPQNKNTNDMDRTLMEGGLCKTRKVVVPRKFNMSERTYNNVKGVKDNGDSIPEIIS